MEKQRIALCVIVGDETPENWQRMVVSAAPYIDGLFVGWTGSEAPSVSAKAELAGVLYGKEVAVQKIEWDWDFSKARNANWAMVPPGQYDWILWLDSDDELINGAGLQDMLAGLKPQTEHVWLPYAYLWDFERDHAAIEHFRERIVRANLAVTWKYPIHEVLLVPPASHGARRDNVWVKHHRAPTEERNDYTRARNRKIITRMLREQPEEVRGHYFLANELIAEAASLAADGDPQARTVRLAAAKEYETFIMGSGGADDDCYIANHRLADIRRQNGDFQAAIDQDLQGVKLRPTWPESWVGIVEAFFESREYGLAREFATIAIMACKRPATVQVFERDTLLFTPYLLRGACNDALGDTEAARKDWEKALEAKPGDAQVEGLLARLGGPVEDKTDDRQRFYSSRPEKSIAFFTRPSFEPWNPEVIARQGSGGAEHAVCEVAKRFSMDGWRVAVFGAPGDYEGEHDGVEWWRSDSFDANERFRTVVATRAPNLFDSPVNTDRKIIWMHDVSVGNVRGPLGDPMQKADFLVGLTKWHARHLARVYKRPAGVIPNGFDPAMFSGGEKDGMRFVWTSSMDRGLDILLESWPQIVGRWPAASLHIYYGWDLIDAAISAGIAPGLKILKERCMEIIEQTPSVIMHGRIPRSELAKEYAKASYWPYISSFCETFCISALETQASGILPATMRLGALPETVFDPSFTARGYANNAAGRQDWMRVLQRVVEAPAAMQEHWRKLARRHAERFTWDAAFDEWRKIT